MRIAYLAQSYPPMISGAAISVQQTAEAMSQRGHHVLVIAASDKEYPYHTYADRLTILRLRSINNPWRVGQRLMICPRPQVMKALKQFNPDAIHAQEPFQMGMLALEYASRSRIPVMITTHQLPWFVASYLPDAFKTITENILWAYARIVLKRYTSIISPTQTIATIIESMTGLKPEVISYGLDLQKFHPHLHGEFELDMSKKLHLPSGAPIILHAGRLDADKGVDKVIRAATPALLKSEAHLLVVGDGSQKYRLLHLCRELDIDEKVHFTGFIPPSTMPEFYRLADIFVTASEIETQGIVLIEAAASGLPIVAVNATCISEIVHDRVNGFLIKQNDIQSFSDAIIALVRNLDRAQVMGREGRILAEDHDIHRTWILHEKLYFEMVRQTRAHRLTKGDMFTNQWDIIKKILGLTQRPDR